MQAPHFSLSDQNGKHHSLSDYKGKWIVVYFYPKDDTPGCTKEACAFRDTIDEFKKRNVVVLGVSKDTIASHKKFAEKFHLNFPILADLDHWVAEQFGAWGLKKFMGREYMGMFRNTYLIDPQGNIAKVYEKVNPLTHTQEILKDIDASFV